MGDQQATVLIVDDEPVVRRILRQRLSAEGYLCEEAADANQATAKINDNLELVILDIKMPGRSGAELLPEIRLKHPDTAVIMATAVADMEMAIECMKQGAYDYFTKPFSLDEVSLSVGRALEKRRLELENRDYRKHLEDKVEIQARKIRTSFLNAVTALAYALEAKDRYTSGHSQRVAQVSLAIARELGLPQESLERIRIAGLIHDIGKIGVRESILNKPSRLTEEEFQQVKCHCELGERILNPIVEDGETLKVVRHHHEHYDGSGYPDGLAGEAIPLGARILAVADAYDAMTSERPYRAALSREVACAEIERGQGCQFDPRVASTFLKIQIPVSSRQLVKLPSL